MRNLYRIEIFNAPSNSEYYVVAATPSEASDYTRKKLSEWGYIYSEPDMIRVVAQSTQYPKCGRPLFFANENEAS